jgi:hypothetical protein
MNSYFNDSIFPNSKHVFDYSVEALPQLALPVNVTTLFSRDAFGVSGLKFGSAVVLLC